MSLNQSTEKDADAIQTSPDGNLFMARTEHAEDAAKLAMLGMMLGGPGTQAMLMRACDGCHQIIKMDTPGCTCGTCSTKFDLCQGCITKEFSITKCPPGWGCGK